MPRRSNDFQKVVYYVRSHLAPDAEVRESVMLADRRSGQLREVDVLVEGHMGGEKIAIAVEVRDHARKQGVEWVDSVYGKYLDLPVNKVVLVSRSGFTTSALQKAKDVGMEALTPHQEINRYGPLARLAVEVTNLTVKGMRLVQGAAYLADQEQPVVVKAETALFDPQGHECATVGWLSNDRMMSPDTEGVPDIFQAAEPGHKSVRVEFAELLMRRTETQQDFTPHIRFTEDSSLHPIERLVVVWEIEVTREPVELQHGAMLGSPFAHGNFEVAGHRAMVVLTGEALDEPLDGAVGDEER